MGEGKEAGDEISELKGSANGNEIGTRKGESKGWHDGQNPKLYWYRMQLPRKIELPSAFVSKEKQAQSLF
jgi:hypothetical protein